MGADDKIRNKTDEAAGKAKEKAGQAAGDEQLESEGQVEQMKAKGKQVADHAGDKAREVADEGREAFKNR
jgi:uncharacterized protein YjbJ (UPF0337 family)